jgi:hypothetical protein
MNKIKAAKDKIEKKSKMQSQNISNKKLNERLQNIATYGQSIENAIKTIAIIKDEGISNKAILTSEKRESIIEAISICGQKITDYELDDIAVSLLKNQTESFEQLIDSYWKQISKEYCNEVVNYLTFLAELTDNPTKSNELLTKINEYSNASPNPIVVKKLKQDTEAANSIVSQYHLNDTVRTFLGRVKQRQASIEDLNPEIITWLKENNLTNKLHISF